MTSLEGPCCGSDKDDMSWGACGSFPKWGDPKIDPNIL